MVSRCLGLGLGGLLVVFSVAGLGASNDPSHLIAAIQNGNQEAVRQFLKQPAELTAREADGTTPLHWAVRVDDLQTTRLLLRAGAEVNVANRYGVTPLMLAATNGNAVTIEALVAAGADVNASLPEGQTVLMTAARTGNPKALAVLLAHGADVKARENWLGETALMWAAAQNHAAAVTLLLEHGADPNLHSNPTTFARKVAGQTVLTRGGFTALMYAARENAIDAARALADGGAALNQGDPDGTTALILSIINGHYDFAAMLVDKGADPNVADATGMTPLYAATDMNTLQFMHGRPPVRPSGQFSSVDTVRRLLEYGADPDAALKTPILQRHNNAPNQALGAGTTPLMRAAKSGDVVVMRLLLDGGADPTLRQANQNTLLMLAAGFGRKFNPNADAQEYEHGTESDLLEAVRLCLSVGQDVNAVNDAGETALHFAAGESIVRFLAQRGATLTVKNQQGKTALDVAYLRKDGSGRQLLPGAVAALRELGAKATVAADIGGPIEQPAADVAEADR